MTKLSIKFSNRLVLALKTSVNDRLSQYEECEAFLLASALDPRPVMNTPLSEPN